MNIPFYIIVGDDYREFAEQENVFSLSDFYEKLLKDQCWPERQGTVLLGQGVSYHDREFIERTLKERQLNAYLPLPPVADLSDTHKRTQENVLISVPKKYSRFNYGFDFSLTDKADRLSDHVTGKHIGAMLLMEAARQATIAVLEDEYCRSSDSSFGLILDRFDSQFSGYLFPLPTSLNTTIEELRSSSKNITVVVKTTAIQCGAVIATISLDVTLCVSRVLSKIEGRKAQSAVKELTLAHLNDTSQKINIA